MDGAGGGRPQALVTFEEVAVCFTREEWASLAEWQRELYWEVMEDNFELVASLGSTPPKPELVGAIEQGDELCVLDARCSRVQDTQGSPGSADRSGATVQEAKVKEEPGACGRPPPSPPAWEAPGPNSRPLALCPSWCEVKLTDVRSLSAGALWEGAWGPSREELLICGECGKSFVDINSLGQHQRAVHGAAEEEDEEEKEEQKGPFICPSCGKAFRYRLNLLTHKKHRGKRRHACTQCGAHFCLRGDLLRHRTSHTAEGGHPCGACGLLFRHKQRLAAHKAEEHPGGKGPLGFSCPECGRLFATESELLRHQKSEHEEGDQPFVCPTCGERFSWRESLQIHQQKHGPERAFRCPLCGKGFSRQGNLLTHQRLHTGELPFACPDCGRGFPSKANLMAHGRLHRRDRPFPCPRCGRCFRLREKLLEHQASHGPQGVKEEAEP